MSQFDKLLQRISSLEKGIRFDEVRKVLEAYGYIMDSPRSGSSHCTFRKKGKNSITIPRHDPIKKIYVIMVKEAIESEVDKNEKP
jgi:predicted RNA binding protein YcfA (HicA-like mRNA interferase family)